MHIYCEGEKTEPNYLNGYLAEIKDGSLRSVITIEPTRKNTPVQLVEVAIEHMRSPATPKGDEFWVVYDREAVAKYPDDLHDRAFVMARNNNINIALSNICFEQWILMHFSDSSAAYPCYNDLIRDSQLKAIFRRETGKDYEKAYTSIYTLLAGRVGDACKRAEKLNSAAIASARPGRNRPHHLSPYTDVPKLLKAIDDFN
jgi:hypothetical protein